MMKGFVPSTDKNFMIKAAQGGMGEVVLGHLTTKTSMADPALVKFVGGIVKKSSVKAAVGGGSTLANRLDSRPTLARVKAPVLLLVGMDDPIYAVEMQKMMKQSHYGAKFAVIPGATHAAIIEKPEACNQAIEGWAGSIR